VFEKFLWVRWEAGKDIWKKDKVEVFEYIKSEGQSNSSCWCSQNLMLNSGTENWKKKAARIQELGRSVLAVVG